MAEPVEREEPDAEETVNLTVPRFAFNDLQTLARHIGLPMDVVLAQLVADAVSRIGRKGTPVPGGASSEGLSTDGIDLTEDAYWRELHDLTQRGDAWAGATPSRAPTR